MAGIERHLLADLKNIVPLEGLIPLVSTVTGDVPAPVTSQRALLVAQHPRTGTIRDRRAGGGQARCALLRRDRPAQHPARHISDSLVGEAEVPWSFRRSTHDQNRDPRRQDRFPGPDQPARGSIPPRFSVPIRGPRIAALYPWQQSQFRFAPTTEASQPRRGGRHPFSGVRTGSDGLEWYAHIDTALFSELAITRSARADLPRHRVS